MFRHKFRSGWRRSLMSAMVFTVCVTACHLKSSKPTLGTKTSQSNHNARGFWSFLTGNKPNPARTERGFIPLAYRLKGRFDWSSQKLLATVEIDLKRTSTLQHLVFDSAGLRILSVRNSNKKALPFRYNAENNELDIQILSKNKYLVKTEDRIFIRYEAAANQFDPNYAHASLRAITPHKNDPSQHAVIYTYSEPNGTSQWMPCDEDPAHRAKFAIDLVLPKNERLIANGDLISDRPVSKLEHRVKYETKFTLPVYLMAFAQSDFQVTTIKSGRLPISVWARTNVVLDGLGIAQNIASVIGRFENKLGRFPFDAYALVLLPQMPGEENAGITFQDEYHSSDLTDIEGRNLTAHEIAHQWFGDFVTIKNWDDLWIKEGMATLLEAEGSRPFEDVFRRGRLFGRTFLFAEGDAIRDKEIEPELKYNTGPYQRGAWMWTQIRSMAGEEQFWKTLRRLLSEHAFGAIDADDVAQAFRKIIPGDFRNRLQTSLEAHKSPRLIVDSEGHEGRIKMTFVDDERAALAPFSVRHIMADGRIYDTPMVVRQKMPLNGDDHEHLQLDPLDLHPLLAFVDPSSFDDAVRPLLVPQSPVGKAAFLNQRSNTQIDALRSTQGWDHLRSEEFEELYHNIGSEIGRYWILRRGCEQGAGQADWNPILLSHLLTPPSLGLTFDSLPNLTACRTVFDGTSQDPVKLLFHAVLEPSASDIILVGSIGFPFKMIFPTWTAQLSRAKTVRTKTHIFNQLLRYIALEAGFPKLDRADRQALLQVSRQYLTLDTENEVVKVAAQIAGDLSDAPSVPLLLDLINGSIHDHPVYLRHLLCQVQRIAKSNHFDWGQVILVKLNQWRSMHPIVRQIIEDPSSCSSHPVTEL